MQKCRDRGFGIDAVGGGKIERVDSTQIAIRAVIDRPLNRIDRFCVRGFAEKIEKASASLTRETWR